MSKLCRTSITEEPDEGNLHVRICGGTGRVTGWSYPDLSTPPNFVLQASFPNSLQTFVLQCNPRGLLQTPWNTTMTENPPRIPLPKSWTGHVRSAILHVVSLAQFAPAYTRSWAANSINVRVRLKAELDRAHQEIASSARPTRLNWATGTPSGRINSAP